VIECSVPEERSNIVRARAQEVVTVTETSGATLRPSALDRLVQLDENEALSVEDVRSAARELGLAEGQLHQWLTVHRARRTPHAPQKVPEAATRIMGYRDAEPQDRAADVVLTTGDDALPRIPDSDVTTFRADAHRELTAPEFARLDAVYTEGIDATCRWLAARTGRPCVHHPGGTAAAIPFGEPGTAGYFWDRSLSATRPGLPEANHPSDRREILGLYRFLGELVCGSPGRGHTVARLRGAQAGFLLHGMRLNLPPDLNYSVGPGLTTACVEDGTLVRIRARATNPVDAAALATALCTGATTVELGSVPCTGLTRDGLVFTGPIGYAQPADLYVWVLPGSVRALLHEARAHQEARPEPVSKLFAGGIGGAGRRLRQTAARCAVTMPELHHWHHSWIRGAGLLRGADSAEPVYNTDLLFALRLAPNPAPPRTRSV
jgi:transposase-like protein